VLRIDGGNFRLLTQAARIQEIHRLASVTPEDVAISREISVIGTQ
jgi:hypothetical protein